MKRLTFRFALRITLAAFMAFSSAALHAQMESPSGAWGLANFDLRTYWWGIVPTGGDFSALYKGLRLVPGLDTILENDLGAGYESDNYYRNADGSLYWGPSGGGSPVLFDRLEILEGIGIRQGILFDQGRDRNLLEGFLFYRIHYDRNFPTAGATQLIFQSALPDRNQILSNSLIAGLSASTLVKDDVHKTRDGLYGEASIQWGPRFLFNSIGNADFFRLNANLKAFRTLFAAPEKGSSNLFSLYVGDFASVDYVGGASIPFYVQESTGGLSPDATTDDWVRGFETGSYGAVFRIVNKLDIRAQGPAVFWPSLVPGAYLFADAGYYRGFYGDPANTPGGFLASAGVGGYLDFFDLANVTGYMAFPLVGRRVDRASFAISFHFTLDF
jgi:hypothetical protein